MKKHFYILTVLLFSTLVGLAQRYKKTEEIGVFLGGSYYMGDLNPVAQFNKSTQPAGGIVFRINVNPRLAFRANAFYGAIAAKDADSQSPSQQQRNLSFQSKISELSAQLEFNFLDYQLGNDKKPFSPYIFFGLAGFKFKPQAEINNQLVDLQPLGTEGQGLAGADSKKKYKLTQLSLPFGIGIKTNLGKYIGLSFEWGMRKTFTDYLDDVSGRYYDPAVLAVKHGVLAAQLSDRSLGTDPNYTNVNKQRGNPMTKDWYSFAGVAITVKFKEGRKRCPGVYK